MWTDHKFLYDSEVVLRFVHIRQQDGVSMRTVSASIEARCPVSPAARTSIHTFLGALTGKSREETALVNNALEQMLVTSEIDKYRVLESKDHVVEIATVYLLARQALFAKVTFFDKGYYRKEMRLPKAAEAQSPGEELAGSGMTACV
jgi:hypothetical protein